MVLVLVGGRRDKAAAAVVVVVKIIIIIIVAMPDSSVCGGGSSSGRPGQVFHKRRCTCRQTVKSVDFLGLGGGSARLLGYYLT